MFGILTMKNFLQSKVLVSPRTALDRMKTYWLSDASFVLLLLILSFTVFILPILISYEKVNVIFVNAIFLLLVFTGIWSSQRKSLIAFTAVLFTIQLGLKFIRLSGPSFDFYLEERVVILINLMVLILLNSKLLFRNSEVSKYRVIGAVNVYLLIALTGAFALEIIQLTTGNSISGDQALTSKDQDFVTYIYFSLVCLTTVGFGDFVPTQITAKMLAVFLSTVGILYPAVVIANLVGKANKY